MNKKFYAIAIAAIMIIGMLPALTTTVQAQTSAWNREDYPYQVNDCDPNTSPMCVFLHPGIPDLYKPGWSHTLDTLWDAQAGDTDQSRQVFEKYNDYAILASASDSIGDLQFDFVVMDEIHYLRIWVPPEFTWLAPTKEESIWTDITNDYMFITTYTESAYSAIPGWLRITIGMDEWWGNTMTINAGIYHVRLFNLRAPEVAGLYHFKIYADGVSIGAGNYPFTIVKTELNPAIVQVTVRAHLNIGCLISGKVMADGTTPEGRAVQGVAYWGPFPDPEFSAVPGALGNIYNTWVFGLAAGTYTFTAEGSGYDPTTTERVTLLPGQSYHIHIVIFDSPNVSVTVWSKHGTGAIPWNNLWQLPYGTNNPDMAPSDDGPWRDILLELYNADNELIGFWGSNVFGPDDGGPYGGPFIGAATKTFPLSNELIGLHDDQAPHPESTDFHAELVDNIDLLGGERMYPSTHWDGHVPWDTADYIAGFPNAQYTVEAFVTGYVMDEADAYQRAFTMIGSHREIQFDLRRSNWIEVSMHLPLAGLPTEVWPIGGEDETTTVTLTAEDTAGNERAAAAFYVYNGGDVNGDGIINGLEGVLDYNTRQAVYFADDYNGGIVIEGWNAVFPNVGGRSGARDNNKKDYGLNPTASTHSGGAVSLEGNPYTIKLYMADMGVPYMNNQWVNPELLGTGWYSIVGGDPQVSVFLCNSRTPLSFSIQNAFIWISLRSVDFEVPAHSRPWTFPGSEVWLEFTDVATGDAAGWLDPTLYGLFQDPGATDSAWAIPGPLGGFGYTPFDIDNVHEAGEHEHLGIRYAGDDYCSGTIGGSYPIYRALFDARSTRLSPGEYMYQAYTHGYIMRRSFPFQIPISGWADIEADLIQGGQIRVTVEFIHEGRPTGFSGYIYAEVYDSQQNFVGASIYGQAVANHFTETANGGAYFHYNEITDHMLIQGPAQAAGLGDETAALYPSSEHAEALSPDTWDSQRAMFSNIFYGVPPNTWPWTPGPPATAGWTATSPCFANRFLMAPGDAQSMDVYGFYWYHGGPVRTWAGGWPTTNGIRSGPSAYTGIQWDYGLKGTVDVPGWEGSGAGLYTVKVWAFDPRGPDDMFDDPADEAAMGHDDWRMYTMAWPLENVEVPWGGAVELYVQMNNLATLRGAVRWFDMYGNLRPLPWAQISASPGPSTDSIPAYSTGFGAVGSGTSDPSGAYMMWLPAGSHAVSVSTSEAPDIWGSSAPTYNAEFTVVVSDGWIGGGDTQLSQSGVPVPELPIAAVPLGLFAVLGVSLWLLRRKNTNIPLVMK